MKKEEELYYNQFSKKELENEIWKDIIGFENYYQVSNLGRARSLDRYVKIGGGGQRLVRSQFIGVKWNPRIKYFYITLIKNNNRKTYSVHRIVFRSFIYDLPSSLDVCHNDSNKYNNRLSNLRADTRKGNEADKKLLKRDNRGDRCGTHKLTWEQVEEIRNLYKQNYGCRDLGVIYNVSSDCIRGIVKNENWVVDNYSYTWREKRHKNFTQEDIKNVFMLYKEGLSPKDIANKISCCEARVRIYLKSIKQ